MNLRAIQKEIKIAGIDGWLFYDFANRDPISYRILGLNERSVSSRRWYYFIPAEGEPQKLMSKVEPKKLESLAGQTYHYLSWEDQHHQLKKILADHKKIAMNYSPQNNIPYVSMVDMGTGELIRSMGIQVVSSMDLIQIFEGRVKNDAFQTHLKAMPIMHSIMNEAFGEIQNRLNENTALTEYDIQKWIMNRYEENNLVTMGMSPSVAVNEHAADPHFDPSITTSQIKKGDLILIDSWAKLKQEGAIFYDITWMAYAGKKIPQRIQDVWEIVREARDRVISFEIDKFEKKEPCHGWELDRVARDYIKNKGFGEYFTHRTGHSIGREVHGNAVHLDSLETRDERIMTSCILHSVEPGIYLPEEKIGIRSEVNVYINESGVVSVTGPMQEEIVRIDCD